MAVRPTYFVSGVTGKQGGAAARHLVAQGYAVKGLTRDPTKTAQLERIGVEPIIGDLRKPETFVLHLKGVAGFYVVTTPFARVGETKDPAAWAEDEVRQQLGALDAADSAGVPHVILGSVGLADQERGVVIHSCKLVGERRARELGLRVTILRPSNLMENWTDPGLLATLRETGLWQLPLKPDTPMPHIASDDIGRIVLWAFEHPETSVGETWELSGEVTTLPGMAKIVADTLGFPLAYSELSDDQARKDGWDEASLGLFRWLDRIQYYPDVAVLEDRFGFRMTSFRELLRRVRPEKT
jgi:uncharacterized protein YbjT (DUF2867 family)